MTNPKQIIKELLDSAGIKINGDKPWDIQVHNEGLYSRVLSGGSLALGESYMDGWWDVEKLDQFFYKISMAKSETKVKPLKLIVPFVKANLLNMQSKSKSKHVAQQHYDLGNDFYENMLDKRMQYTCAYWKNAKTLDQAQEAKLDLVCRKTKLKKGDRVLELGGGWGGFAKYAAQKYGCHVTSYNISEEQVKYARELCKGLPVQIILGDYRESKGKYDKVISIGMCEHVGYKNYKKFMQLAYDCLDKGGIFFVHTIASNKSVKSCEPWFDKYIFPHGMLPSVEQLGKAMDKLFILEDWHNFGTYYDKTLMEWYKNFDKNWYKFQKQYGDRFYRMWKYYLLSLPGTFRARGIQLWQIVLSKDGVPGGYESER